MGAENRPLAEQPGRGDDAPSLVALPFLKRKLDELYEALKDAPYAKSLLEAKASLEAKNYGKALQLVEATRQLCTPTPLGAGRTPTAAPLFGKKATRAGTVDVLSGLDTVLRLLRPLGDWHRRQPKAAGTDAPLQTVAPQADGALAAEPATDEPAGDTVEEGVNLAKQYSGVILERGAFSQLLTAAQRCGLVANPDVIIAVRDREFPAGRYQRAFEMIESQYIQFGAQASQRLARIRREEIQYKAGTLKMSMKEWLARQQRVIEQNQRIERARRHFTRVLDALRVIRVSSGK